MRTHLSVRGFSILEALFAMVILTIGLTAALAALNRGAVESRLGQNRQAKTMLADASLQRLKMVPKNTYFSALPVQPTSDITNVAVGAAPWVPDPTTSGDPNDLSLGAYFTVTPDGTIARAVGVPANTPCSAAAVTPGMICREVFTHTGGPFGGTNIAGALDAGFFGIATTWVRITRKPGPNFPAEQDIVLREVVIQ